MSTRAPTPAGDQRTATPTKVPSGEQENATTASPPTNRELALHQAGLDRIVANPHQPRQAIDNDALQTLAASIREHGILQPPIVHARPDGTYQLVAGERRIRAARLAGLEEIPVLVRPAPSATEHLLFAVIENIQRQDLGPLEKARAYAELQQAAEETTGRHVGVRELATNVVMSGGAGPARARRW